MKLLSAAGDEMVITVEPTGNDLRSEVRLDFKDHSPNEAIRRRRLQAVDDALAKDFGATRGAFVTDPGFETRNAPDDRFRVPATARETGNEEMP